MRQTIDFNDNWNFTKDGQDWQKVRLPHTWNAIDGMDGKGEYYRGECTYTKEFDTPLFPEGGRVCLEILAAGLSGKVYVNQSEAGSHEGGYSSFTVDITDALYTPEEKKANTVTITVDNSLRSNIYPQMADFTFYGGLYRGVNLLILPRTHFEVSYHGASGLAVTPEVLSDGNAMLHLNTWIANPSPDYTVRYLITDGSGREAAECWRPSEDTKADILLPAPRLWQGVEDPYLYHCTATLVYRNESVDQTATRFGIRSFRVDPEKGFFLNGKPMMLRGVSRHQDRLWMGNALTRAEHYEDAAIIREMGANTVRLAHYQHSRDFYDACDEYGFIVWAEIPYISCQSDDPAAHQNCRLQMEDLIYQNYNHPSICFWGISNEITIAGEKPDLVKNHKDLNSLVKQIDPSRLTTIAHVTMLPMEHPLHGITDVESYNHYFGWYGGSYENNETWLDEFHGKHPDICLGLSEYGAEGIITYQPDDPKCRDYSESYQAEYHEHMAKILMERPYLWSTHVWNMFDFGCAARNEGGTAGRNNKGLVTMDRKIKKEAFYVYKAYWSKEPFVHLCGRRYSERASDTITVKVYSNLDNISLYVNGEPFATLHGDKIFIFENVPLGEGFTFLTAEGRYEHFGCGSGSLRLAGSIEGMFASCGSAMIRPGSSPEIIDSCHEQHNALNAPSGHWHICRDTITLEKVAEKPEIYTLPQEDDGEYVANWFDHIETVASDAPVEFSEKHYSVCDTLNDIMANDEAFRILSNAMYSMTGMKMKKSMMAMMGGKTLQELTAMMGSMGGPDTGKKVPGNAMQILNSELNRISKK